MFSFSLPVSLALAHRKERITALPFPISVRGGSQSDLERSWGSGGLSSDPEMSVIHSFIPLCLFRAPSAYFTWWHRQEVAGGCCTAMPMLLVQFAFDTCSVLCVHLSGREKLQDFFLKHRTNQRRDRGRCPAGPQQKLMSLPGLWLQPGARGNHCFLGQGWHLSGFPREMVLALCERCREGICASPTDWDAGMQYTVL